MYYSPPLPGVPLANDALPPFGGLPGPRLTTGGSPAGAAIPTAFSLLTAEVRRGATAALLVGVVAAGNAPMPAMTGLPGTAACKQTHNNQKIR